MQYELYNCSVRLNGNLLHEVAVTDVTNKELALLKDIHGADAVVHVVKTGKTVERDDRMEYFRIIEKYGSRDDMGATGRMKKRVEKLFSVSLDDFDGWLSGKLEDAADAKDAKAEQRDAEAEALQAEAKRKAEVAERERIRVDETARIRAQVEADLREKIEAETLEKLTKPAPAVAENVASAS